MPNILRAEPFGNALEEGREKSHSKMRYELVSPRVEVEVLSSHAAA